MPDLRDPEAEEAREVAVTLPRQPDRRHPGWNRSWPRKVAQRDKRHVAQRDFSRATTKVITAADDLVQHEDEAASANRQNRTGFIPSEERHPGARRLRWRLSAGGAGGRDSGGVSDGSVHLEPVCERKRDLTIAARRGNMIS